MAIVKQLWTILEKTVTRWTRNDGNLLAASMAYYAALGFSPVENYVLDQGLPWLDVINETPGIKLRAQMMRDADGNTIELLKVFEPACFGTRERQPLNRFGLTHIAFGTTTWKRRSAN